MLEDRVSILLRVIVVLVGSFVAVAVSRAFFLNSPRVRTCREQARQFHAFCKAIKQAAGTLELQEILDSAAKVIVEATGVQGCSIKLLSSKTGKMIGRTIVGLGKDRSDQALDIVEDIYKKGSMARESVIVRDIYMRDFPSVDEEFESLICVPLVLEEKPLGAICIFGQRGQRLSPAMINLLASLGDVVSLAIAHALVYEDLKNLVATKTKFMFQASHELRSPLNTIQSMARTLLEGHLGKLSTKQIDMLSRIDRRSQMLSEIVGDLLILAVGRAELSTLKPETVDLKGLLLDNVRFFETRAREKRIELQLHNRVEDGVVLGNREGLASVITNLLSNAIKYTPEEGRVTVSLFESKEQVVVEISDTGIGIPKEEQSELFSEFFRASNAKEMARIGTGLGLAIVKAMVEQHGGSIDFESERGKGTTFRILLNRVQQPASPDA
ncbi:MAG: GAF domain-containing sensor histidine kinase [Spirochaetaceae bacterium]|nr:MAG: GAF domain-containing sensor histidine kinase [Spirochaetaceae bacterium]